MLHPQFISGQKLVTGSFRHSGNYFTVLLGVTHDNQKSYLIACLKILREARLIKSTGTTRRASSLVDDLYLPVGRAFCMDMSWLRTCICGSSPTVLAAIVVPICDAGCRENGEEDNLLHTRRFDWVDYHLCIHHSVLIVVPTAHVPFKTAHFVYVDSRQE